MILLIVLFVWSTGALPAQDQITDREIERYWKNLGDSSAKLNISGGLAWTEAHRLESLTDMYEATGDISFLRELVRRYDQIFANRDDRIGKFDEIRNRTVKGWGSTAYTEGSWHVHVVHTGMILFPAMKFCTLVRSDPLLANEFSTKANEYLNYGTESVLEFDEEWRESRDEGFYVQAASYPNNKGGAVLPFNMALALGKAMLEILHCTGDALIRDRVNRLAKWFKNSLRLEFENVWTWYYRIGGGVEDIAHGAIDVSFAILAQREGIVFTEKDLVAFSNTLLYRILKGNGEVSSDVAGKSRKPAEASRARQVMRWIELAAFNSTVYERLKGLWLDRNDFYYSSLGHTKVLKWNRIMAER